LYHHLDGEYPCFGLPKLLKCESDGSLKCCLWSGVEKLWYEKVKVHMERVKVQALREQLGLWSVCGDSLTIDGSDCVTTGLLDSEILTDMHLRLKVRFEGCSRFAVSVRDCGIGAKDTAPAIQADVANGLWQFGRMSYNWFGMMLPVENVRIETELRCVYQIDIIVRDVYFEAYLNGEWIFTRNIESFSRQGQVGITVEGGKVIVQELEVFRLKPMLYGFYRSSE